MIVCADVGSTYTKVAAVDAETGRLYGTAAHRTTIDTDVLDGLDAARERVEAELPSGASTELLVCSSAGGGLRLGVIGNEPLVTATAAHRAGLSAGARVVAIISGYIETEAIRKLTTTAPDILLLAGGTDGGDATVLIEHAHTLAAASASDERLRLPVVLAGNTAAATEVTAILTKAGLHVTAVDNVLPRIGQLNPAPARIALREAFLKHVIAGKHLSDRESFAALVRSATPDAVLSGVEVLAESHGDLVVVDVGGATTDVYSVLTPDAELSGPRREVAGTAWRSRTVEGDLGLRHTAPGIVAAAETEALLEPGEAEPLREAAARRAEAPSWLPDTAAEIAVDLRLTRLAITIALRRHARGERLGGPQAPLRGGKDLRQVSYVIGSGGVLRNHGAAAGEALRQAVCGDTAGGYPLPENPVTVIDTSYVLGAAGLLAHHHPDLAATLLDRHLSHSV
ncbi:glutamate mutase L [Stackebrandtia nassauensis]|uniref:Glutamate mutase, large subunit, B12-dependent n=1 Tax=Stackebrandtia nassauensis (strain DSM 44728 / CIP 108903 / NRRL B-16338 / NBRC 102104 / LLR-40K-21) TaxID=446470 RepID=D3PZR2_STANL|nr:glutamate mutase, large subunit, B12-dependent [Stackebrandtia nassauensis DSM 44728]